MFLLSVFCDKGHFSKSTFRELLVRVLKLQKSTKDVTMPFNRDRKNLNSTDDDIPTKKNSDAATRRRDIFDFHRSTSADIGSRGSRESGQDALSVEASSADEPPSPEGRLQPEDLSVTTKSKEVKDVVNTADSLPPLKTPELKLSVRKLLGCSPSPPPITRDRSVSPENCLELKSQQPSNEGKASKTLIQAQEEAAKGKRSIYIYLYIVIYIAQRVIDFFFF